MYTPEDTGKNVFFYDFPLLGETAIAANPEGICAILKIKKQKKDLKTARTRGFSLPDVLNPDIFIEKESPLIKKAADQVREYLSGKRKAFDLPLSINGTQFQQRVYKNLINIQYGKTISYKELAEMTGSPRAFRAVGIACGKNPVLLLVPCHRCIAVSGKLTGFAAGIDIKRQLLELEKQ